MNHRVGVATVLFALTLVGCDGSASNPNGAGSELGGNTGKGDVVGSGGAQSSRSTSKTGSGSNGLGGKSTVTSSSRVDRSEGGSASSTQLTSAGGASVTNATGGVDAAGGSRTRTTTSSARSTPVGGNTSATNTETGGVPGAGGSKVEGTTAIGGAKNVGGTTANGGTPASGGTSTNTDSKYVPCAASPCKVLPLGDSITHGLQSSDGGGYRSQLFKLVVAAKQTLTFVGTQSAGPANVSGVAFPKNHEGHDGYTIESGFSTYGTAGIGSRIPSPAFSTVPDIVLLHIGTNDITSTGSASATASDRLDGLLGKIVAAAPKALIVVAQITPVSWTSGDLNTYNSKIPGIVQARAAQGQHIISVDMSQMPKSGLATDGVHPNDQGYTYMANAWYAGIKDFLL